MSLTHKSRPSSQASGEEQGIQDPFSPPPTTLARVLRQCHFVSHLGVMKEVEIQEAPDMTGTDLTRRREMAVSKTWPSLLS